MKDFLKIVIAFEDEGDPRGKEDDED